MTGVLSTPQLHTTTHHTPDLPPHSERPKALVVGAGVSGWTTALVLAQRRWDVTVVADRVASDTVSSVAGAVWEWPPSVCGRHHDDTVLARTTNWALRSYGRFAQLASDPRTGVSLRPAVFYFTRRIEELPDEFAKMAEVEEHLPGFVHDAGLIDAHGINRDAGVVDAYSYLTPTIDTDRYLTWLSRQAAAAGVKFVQTTLCGPLVEQQHLFDDYAVELVVNCAGLGARELAGDLSMDPHRGALIRMVNDGTSMPQVTAVQAMANDTSTDEQNMIFIVPRGPDRLLLGGLVEAGEYGVDLALGDYPPLQNIIDRCTEFLPSLRGARLDPVDPVRVGLRPFRHGGVRLEAEPGTRIVHNYGHGGAGVTLSWGCAHEAADLASEILFPGLRGVTPTTATL